MTSSGRVFVIAEAGVNHNGSLEKALALVERAAEAGADAVKFQTFRASSLAALHAPKAGYQQRTTAAGESQLAMLAGLELSEADHRILAARSEKAGIEFLSTPFDPESATFLARDIGIRRIKLGSGEITNGPFLLHIAGLGLPVILSTGMSTLDEVKLALSVLAYGFGNNRVAPGPASFAAAFDSAVGQEALRQYVTLLHCTTEYPAPAESINLRAMATMAAAFDLPVGFSDHSVGISAALAAAALGAVAIEKHFTLDRALPGPDHRASLEPAQLAAMIDGIRTVEKALGSPVKKPAPVEEPNRIVARRSVVAAKEIRRGDFFDPSNIACKRPGDGISPMKYWSLLGRRATRDYASDEAIAESEPS